MNAPATCSHCGAPFAPGAKVCIYCEIGVRPEVPTEPVAPEASTAEASIAQRAEQVARNSDDDERAARRSRLKDVSRDAPGKDKTKTGSDARRRRKHDERAPSTEEQLAENYFFAMVGAAYLVAAANDDVTAQEVHELINGISDLYDGQVDPEITENAVAEWDEILADRGPEASLEWIADALPEPGDREQAFRNACAIAWIDVELDDDEEEALFALAEALHIPEEDAERIYDEIAAAMAGPG